jgi:hypothetical protein
MVRQNPIIGSIMKKLFYLLPLVFIFGCEYREEVRSVQDTSPTVINNKLLVNDRPGYWLTIQTITHDDCEYIIVQSTDGVSVVHKQNCKYCLERSKENK